MRKFVFAVACAFTAISLGPALAQDTQPLVPKITTGASQLTVGGTVQVWTGIFSHPDNTYMKLNGFSERFRREELHLDGKVDPKLSYHVNVDFARGSSTSTTLGWLQDLFVQYNVVKGGDLIVGQTKLPLGIFGVYSSGHLPVIERPMYVIDSGHGDTAGLKGIGTWGDIRDPGVQFHYDSNQISAQVALTEGAGEYQNLTDNKYGKQVTGQFLYRPSLVPHLQLGVTGSAGAGFRPADNSRMLRRNRGGVSLVYNPGRWLVQSEYMAGLDDQYKSTTLSRHGEYGLVGYDLGGYKKGNGNQVVAMYDYWDSDQQAANAVAQQRNLTIGINHDMDGGARRLQLNYVHEHINWGPGSVGQSSDSDGIVAAMIVNW